MVNFSRNERGLESLSTPLSQIRSQWALPSGRSLSPWPHPLFCLDYCTSRGPEPQLSASAWMSPTQLPPWPLPAGPITSCSDSFLSDAVKTILTQALMARPPLPLQLLLLPWTRVVCSPWTAGYSWEPADHSSANVCTHQNTLS